MKLLMSSASWVARAGRSSQVWSFRIHVWICSGICGWASGNSWGGVGGGWGGWIGLGEGVKDGGKNGLSCGEWWHDSGVVLGLWVSAAGVASRASMLRRMGEGRGADLPGELEVEGVSWVYAGRWWFGGQGGSW